MAGEACRRASVARGRDWRREEQRLQVRGGGGGGRLAHQNSCAHMMSQSQSGSNESMRSHLRGAAMRPVSRVGSHGCARRGSHLCSIISGNCDSRTSSAPIRWYAGHSKLNEPTVTRWPAGIGGTGGWSAALRKDAGRLLAASQKLLGPADTACTCSPAQPAGQTCSMGAFANAKQSARRRRPKLEFF